MNRPVTVRIGLALLLLALILRGAALVISIPQMLRAQGTTSGAGGAVASLLFYAVFVYAIAQRRNWARLIFAFLLVTGSVLAFCAVLSPEGSMLAMWRPSAPQFANLVLVGSGMICLFMPSAAEWFHGVRAAA